MTLSYRMVTCVSRPDRRLDREAGVGIVQARAEQLAEAVDAIAHRLRMDVELGGDRGDPALMAQVGGESLEEPVPARRGLVRERLEQERCEPLETRPPLVQDEV